MLHLFFCPFGVAATPRNDKQKRPFIVLLICYHNIPAGKLKNPAGFGLIIRKEKGIDKVYSFLIMYTLFYEVKCAY